MFVEDHCICFFLPCNGNPYSLHQACLLIGELKKKKKNFLGFNSTFFVTNILKVGRILSVAVLVGSN